MVAVKDSAPRFTPTEYFAWEEQQLERHEYINGEVYAMSGGTINHSEIAAKFNRLLGNHLDDSGCRTLNSDARINILETDDYSYPDGSVTCDKRDKSNTQYIAYPCLIVEVLSDSTEAYDSPLETLRERGEKFYRYRRNPILQDYVLVSAKSISIDIYHKNDAGEWVIINYRTGDIVELKSIDLSFSIEQVYRGIVFE
ncbi:Uma2 family endonuclease [Chamaesiphon sp. VAR_69_metabat_338]|uniref:Uma2 family endonuclease n=1 Tax=Chamaesiphon sp. VAR_69_metabat_338 TaxID=2964704 RepID=UPI00286E3ADE|nr:Uma2 family endonuclease [Chamaesiphon sp. VAR_69_metabat_338]